MGRKRTRRQPHGSAWYWKQTGCWYYTPRGTEQRVSLFDEDGNRIRGPANKHAAQLALARIKLAGGGPPEAPPPGDDAWLVARVCSEYLQYCERGVAGRTSGNGSGLGLYVSRALMRGMGGDLTLDEVVPGRGATFRMTLPGEPASEG